MDNISLFFLIFGLSNHSPILDTVMIFGAEFLIYLAFLLVLVLTFKGGVKEKKALILIILTIPIVILVIKGIHLFFFEPRPFVSFHFLPLIGEKADASFPSRHTSIMSVIAFAYTYFKSRWGPLFLLFMVWVGIGRIYVGVHYPLDILGGFFVGIISLMIAMKIKNLLKVTLLR